MPGKPNRVEVFDSDCQLTIFGHSNYYPAAMPTPTPKNVNSQPQSISTDCTANIGVIDVGFIQFAPNTRTSQMNLPVDYVVPPIPLTEDVGHGESVAWLISLYAPNAGIHGVSVQPIWSGPKQYHGMTTGALLSFALNEFLKMEKEKRPAIISLTAGGPVPGGPMNAVRTAIQQAKQMGILVVSAIGNDGLHRATYPAAWPEVLAVGATDAGGPAGFNNMLGGPFEEYIDVFAPGRHVVPFLNSAGFDGKAEILGTSFAVPVVVGELAASCETTSDRWASDPKAAALEVLEENRAALEERGFVIPKRPSE
jgi:hypothetical protein